MHSMSIALSLQSRTNLAGNFVTIPFPFPLVFPRPGVSLVFGRNLPPRIGYQKFSRTMATEDFPSPQPGQHHLATYILRHQKTNHTRLYNFTLPRHSHLLQLPFHRPNRNYSRSSYHHVQRSFVAERTSGIRGGLKGTRMSSSFAPLPATVPVKSRFLVLCTWAMRTRYRWFAIRSVPFRRPALTPRGRYFHRCHVTANRFRRPCGSPDADSMCPLPTHMLPSKQQRLYLEAFVRRIDDAVTQSSLLWLRCCKAMPAAQPGPIDKQSFLAGPSAPIQASQL